MKEKITEILGIVLDLLFPPVCLACRRRLNRSETTNLSESTNSSPFSFLCPSCSQKIKINNTAFCHICSRRLPENNKTCHRDSPFVLAAAGFYGDKVLDELIALLKYQKIKQAAIP